MANNNNDKVFCYASLNQVKYDTKQFVVIKMMINYKFN